MMSAHSCVMHQDACVMHEDLPACLQLCVCPLGHDSCIFVQHLHFIHLELVTRDIGFGQFSSHSMTGVLMLAGSCKAECLVELIF